MADHTQPRLERGEHFHKISFTAMASPCELLVESGDYALDLLNKLADATFYEVKRIEKKFSRYLKNNLCYAINNACGAEISIDEECFRLLEFANECYLASSGLFDITSGVLRQIWRFDGGSCIPEQAQIDNFLKRIGWKKVSYDSEHLQMPSGMEVDFGDIGKEYAVNRVAQLCTETAFGVSVLVNFGGDIQISCPRKNNEAWVVGIETPALENAAQGVLKIGSGALATSGDAKRFLFHKGQRYSHILDPLTGWPVRDAPRSVTVATQQCVQAGCLATMALLQGKYAEEFLKAQDVNYWCVWE